MSKKDVFLIIALVFGVWIADYLTKNWALYLIKGISTYGPIGFVIHKNPGAMLGTFSELPPILRIVSLSTGGAFLIFIYGALQYLIPKRALTLRCGMSLLLGGILGNVTDRMISGAVTDFIFFKLGGWNSPAFNFADAIQWVGYFMIIYTLIFNHESLWPNKDDRKQIWVIPKFQIKYILIMMFVGLGFAAISGVFSYTFIMITIDELSRGNSALMEKRFLRPFLITYSTIFTSFLVLLYIIGRFISHKTAGPIYAFEKYVNDLLAGKDRKFNLRSGDELTHLEELANRLRESIIKSDDRRSSEASQDGNSRDTT